MALLSWDGSLIRGKLSHIQHSEHPTMVSIRRIVTQWGRQIVGGLIVTLLFSQMALAMYAAPSWMRIRTRHRCRWRAWPWTKPPACPPCRTAMPCQGRWTTSLRSYAVPIAAVTASPRRLRKGLDVPSIAAAHAVWIAYLLPVVPDPQSSTGARFDPAWLDHRTALPSISFSSPAQLTPGRARRALARQNTWTSWLSISRDHHAYFFLRRSRRASPRA